MIIKNYSNIPNDAYRLYKMTVKQDLYCYKEKSCRYLNKEFKYLKKI